MQVSFGWNSSDLHFSLGLGLSLVCETGGNSFSLKTLVDTVQTAPVCYFCVISPQSAKIFNYAKWESTCNGIFVVFAAIFIVTRLIIFPFWWELCVWLLFPSSDKESGVFYITCMHYLFIRTDIKNCLCLMYLYSRIIHCTWVYPPDYYPPFFGYYFFNFMLVILLMLHIFWAYLILRMVKMFLFGSVSCSTFIFGNAFIFFQMVLFEWSHITMG